MARKNIMEELADAADAMHKVGESMRKVGESMRKVGEAARKAAITSQRFGAVANWSLRHDIDFQVGKWASKPATFPEWRSRPGLFGFSKQGIAMQNPGKHAGPSQKGSCRRRRAGKAT